MNRYCLLIAMFVSGLVFVSGSAVADDEKKPDEKPKTEKPAKAPEPKAPDWSKFAKAGEAGGELVKMTDETITLRNQVPRRSGNRTTITNVDVEYTWSEQGLARRDKPPTFFNDKGLPRTGTSDEIARLKKPAGVPGYMMERSELKNGDIVKLELVRPSNIPASKAKPEDLRIKYAIVMGEKAKPSKPPKE